MILVRCILYHSTLRTRLVDERCLRYLDVLVFLILRMLSSRDMKCKGGTTGILQ